MAKSPRAILHAARLADALLFWPVLVVVAWGQLQPEMPEAISAIDDKVLHFGAYFLLGAMAGGAVKRLEAVLWAGLGLILIGTMLELIQAHVGRETSLLDGLANTAGAITGAVLARLAIEPLRKRWAELPETAEVQALHRPGVEL